MGKIKAFFKGLSNLFKNMSDIVEYSDTQKKNEQRLDSIDETLRNMNTVLGEVGSQVKNVTGNQDKISQDMEKVKSGLQKELFQSLQVLHEKYTARKWASLPEKLEAKMYYDEIHNMGKDGWSTKYYEEIFALPENERDAYKD